jgi:hypothetical protein
VQTSRLFWLIRHDDRRTSGCTYGLLAFLAPVALSTSAWMAFHTSTRAGGRRSATGCVLYGSADFSQRGASNAGTIGPRHTATDIVVFVCLEERKRCEVAVWQSWHACSLQRSKIVQGREQQMTRESVRVPDRPFRGRGSSRLPQQGSSEFGSTCVIFASTSNLDESREQLEINPLPALVTRTQALLQACMLWLRSAGGYL